METSLSARSIKQIYVCVQVYNHPIHHTPYILIHTSVGNRGDACVCIFLHSKRGNRGDVGTTYLQPMLATALGTTLVQSRGGDVTSGMGHDGTSNINMAPHGPKDRILVQNLEMWY